VLPARIYAMLPLICPERGSPMQLIAAVTEREPVRRILRHLGDPPPAARSPPEEQALDWDQTSGAASSGCDPSFEPSPEFQFDQTVSWQSVRCQQATPTRSSCPAEPPCAGAGSTSPQGRCGRLRTPHCRRPKPEMAPQASDPIDPSR
jgi:hypothetical protein